MSDHTFIICAYKESPYLEECVQSCLNQTVKTQVILSTSTPNAYIDEIVEKYNLPCFVNNGPSGICEDWNYGISNCTTPYFTVAHQDDIYKPDYVKEMLEAFKKAKNPIIYFCGYGELRNGREVTSSTLLNIKKMMLLPLCLKSFQNSKWIRRRILSLGNPISCPSVSYCRENLPEVIFDNHFKCDLDWDAWERLSKRKGTFCYQKKVLMCHRIHEDSTTTELIENNIRLNEDYEMYCRFWPKSIAGLLNRYYKKSLESNTVKE